MNELTDDFFEKAGFDTDKKPFTKNVVDGVTTVYKNYIRDGSGNYEGYIVTKPCTFVARDLDQFLGIHDGSMPAFMEKPKENIQIIDSGSREIHEYAIPDGAEDIILALQWMRTVYDHVDLDYGVEYGAPVANLYGYVRK